MKGNLLKSKSNNEYKSIRITFTLDKRTLDVIDEIAAATHGSKSSAIRLAVADYAKRQNEKQ